METFQIDNKIHNLGINNMTKDSNKLPSKRLARRLIIMRQFDFKI